MTGATRQTGLAILLALLLGAAWTVGDWTSLAALNLPDTDDVMRLQQVRDWIAGQPFADVSQQRVGYGLAMHWSRIGDLVPAGLILLARPFLGQHSAEVFAIVAWPTMQFAALLALTAGIVRVLAPRAVATAIVLAALAYPAASLFVPGRIDHHGLQLLLVLVQVRALLLLPTHPHPFRALRLANDGGGNRSLRAGLIAGIAVALGAAIGLETAPFAVVTTGWLIHRWLHHGEGTSLSAFGLALAGASVALSPIAARGGVCDTIAPLLPIVIAGGLALSALGRVQTYRLAWFAAAATALAILGWPAAQPCLSGPYGTVDPLVRHLWLAQVAEAQPLVAAPLSSAIAYAGLLATGLLATVVLARRDGGAWWRLLSFQAMAAAITLAQVRGAYVGAALAVVPIATLLSEARARRAMPTVLALWIAGTGISWSLLAGLTEPKAAQAAPSCTRAGVIARLSALPPGRVMAGIDLGSYILAGTRHSVVAAPYHRNDAGNRALYRFFLGDPAEAKAVARDWAVDYVVICPGDLGAVHAPPSAIGGGARPAWLHPITPPGALPAIFATHPRLSAAHPAR